MARLSTSPPAKSARSYRHCEQSDTAEAAIIHPVHDESRGWTWRPEPL